MLNSVLHTRQSDGVGPAWSEASVDEVSAFLASWKASRFDLFRAGYQALTQLLQAAWYDNATSWAAIGYPGPPLLALGAPR